MPSEKFKLQYNETILYLLYCKIIKEQSDNADKWMVHLRMKANECKYKEKDRRQKEQSINGINSDDRNYTRIDQLTKQVRSPVSR